MQTDTNGAAPAPQLHRLTDVQSDLSDESIQPVPDLHAPVLEPIPKAFPPFKLMATIKKSSKYYHQGLSDPYNRKSKPRAFVVTAILLSDADGYDFKFNSNAYRREDVTLWIEVAGKLKKI